ncbi:MAG: peptide deformylase [Bacteriovoracaceae bacterium]|jgi:peptide deformylase|nr:peptide deformylase [Bacteriovoracaceae bacterium]
MKNIIPIVSVLFSLSSFGHTTRHHLEGPLEIITIGHPTLRMKAENVSPEEIQTETFQTFLDDLIQTLDDSGGVGLAAPQVNVSKRVFVMRSGFFVPLTIVINPEVKYLSQHGTKKSTEGCLSIPGKRFRVKRYKRVHLDYLNRHGEAKSEPAKGFKAIIIQHEFDHLNGVMIADFFTPIIEFVEPSDYVTTPLM